MEARNVELPPKPPGAVDALVSGFNATTLNLGLVLFPVALDVFLWLGPRLKVDTLFTSTLEELSKVLGAPILSRPEEMEKVLDGFNLFSRLRTYPFGVFSLMLNNSSGTSILGVRPDWEISSWLMLIGLSIILTCVGLFFGSLYFYCVSRVALKPGTGPSLLRTVFHSLLIWSVFTFFYFIGLLFLPFGALLLMNNLVIMLILLLFFAWPITWVGLMIFFSTHGVFIFSKNAFASLGQNFRLLRYGMPPMGWFAFMAIVISQGMDLIWRIPATDSWMALIGIFGHAFVSTALLAGSFIFYRDLNSWVDQALAWVKTHQITSARV